MLPHSLTFWKNSSSSSAVALGAREGLSLAGRPVLRAWPWSSRTPPAWTTAQATPSPRECPPLLKTDLSLNTCAVYVTFHEWQSTHFHIIPAFLRRIPSIQSYCFALRQTQLAKLEKPLGLWRVWAFLELRDLKVRYQKARSGSAPF